MIAGSVPLIMFAAVAAQPVDSSAVTRAQPQLHTPDVIAPAVLPYLACLYALRGLPPASSERREPNPLRQICWRLLS